jgi:hypothetical protein
MREGGWEEGQEGAYEKGAEVGVEVEGTSVYTSCQYMAITPLKFKIHIKITQDENTRL